VNSARFDYILRQVLVVPVFAILIGAAALYWQMHAADQTVTLIEAADATITQTLQVERLILDQETGLRGYQTTSNPTFLTSYNEAVKQLPAAFDQLRAEADPAQAATASTVDDLQTLHGAWEQGFAVPLIATIQAGGKTSDTDLNLQGKVQMDAIRHDLVRLTQAAEHSRAAYISRWQTQVRRMTFALLLIAVVIGLAIGLYTRTLLHDLSDAFKRSSNILRIRAEEAFRSEERLRTTLASIGDGVITCTLDGHVQTMNQVAQDLTGWSQDEAHNQPLASVFAIFDNLTREPLEDPILRSQRAGNTVRLGENTLLLRKDGAELQIDDSLSLIRDKRSDVMGFILVFRDVTLARKSQQALLANEKLAVAGRLAATIAHEIHNPLDSISNLLFLMDGPSTPEESAHFLSLARQETARVTQISRAMLSLYRESRAPVPIDLKDMLESILLLMERRFLVLGVTVQQELPPNLIIHGFPAELRQVFTNLLANASEAAGPGAVIHLTAAPDPAHLSANGLRREPGVLVAVQDHGPGIPEDIRPKLFQPFFTTKGDQGTGLG
jgi:PAS domain S-box-containing protein